MGRGSFFKFCAAVFVSSLFISACNEAEPPLLTKEKIEAIEILVQNFVNQKEIPGFSIGIAYGGEILWTRGYGLADTENNVPATPETVYRTASIGKVLTATAAMQLVEQGAIDLDTPIQKYCPQFPEKEWPITTRHLLAHQSGIRHYGGPNDDAEQYNLIPYDSVAASLYQFKDDPLNHQPGTEFTYSTFGFTTLGCVIEGASGEQFLDYMANHIFQPAGMVNSQGDDPRAIIPGRAAGYVREGGFLLNSRYADMSSKMPAGGYVTTVVDMLNFTSALATEKLLSNETIVEMFTHQPFNDGSVSTVGLGWNLSDPDDLFYGELEAIHGGGTPTVSAFLYVLPNKDFFTVVFFSNLEHIHGRVDLAAEITLIALELGDSVMQPAQ